MSSSQKVSMKNLKLGVNLFDMEIWDCIDSASRDIIIDFKHCQRQDFSNFNKRSRNNVASWRYWIIIMCLLIAKVNYVSMEHTTLTLEQPMLSTKTQRDEMESKLKISTPYKTKAEIDWKFFVENKKIPKNKSITFNDLMTLNTNFNTPSNLPNKQKSLVLNTNSMNSFDRNAEFLSTYSTNTYSPYTTDFSDRQNETWTMPNTHSKHSLSKKNRSQPLNRYVRNIDVEVDRCRLFTEGDPTKNEFYSPEYPNLYPKNINCTRVITAPKGQIIRLDFRNTFHIESKEECKFDFLEIRDGKYGFSSLIGKYCGTDFPPEITSKERYLWLHFHSDETIEYEGFNAVYEFLDRSREAPSTDLNCTIEKDGYEGFINSTDVPQVIRDTVIRNKIALDCIYRIQVQDKWKIQLKFLDFHLSKPNDCESNFLDIFPEQTVMPLRVKNFCGSAGESITGDSNILHMRFYAEQVAINSTFSILYTAYRDRGVGGCTEDEYDCEDATCISSELRCNGMDNCKFRWDEEGCGTESSGQSEHVVIIIIVFVLILGGMVITFVVNCIRKIIRDQKIIREHIRESKESKLNEMGREFKGCPSENLLKESILTTTSHDGLLIHQKSASSCIERNVAPRFVSKFSNEQIRNSSLQQQPTVSTLHQNMQILRQESLDLDEHLDNNLTKQSNNGLIMSTAREEPQEMCYHHNHQQQLKHTLSDKPMASVKLHRQLQPEGACILTAEPTTTFRENEKHQQQQRRREEAKVVIDIRNSTPDVIIMTSQ